MGPERSKDSQRNSSDEIRSNVVISIRTHVIHFSVRNSQYALRSIWYSLKAPYSKETHVPYMTTQYWQSVVASKRLLAHNISPDGLQLLWVAPLSQIIAHIHVEPPLSLLTLCISCGIPHGVTSSFNYSSTPYIHVHVNTYR